MRWKREINGVGTTVTPFQPVYSLHFNQCIVFSELNYVFLQAIEEKLPLGDMKSENGCAQISLYNAANKL